MAHQPGHGDLTKRRLTNGHGITTSLWSASHIGAEPRPVPFQMPRAAYRAEAMRVSDAVKRRHDPSVRNMHLQKNYPETRRLLQPPHGAGTHYETPRALKGASNLSFPPHNLHQTKWDRNDVPAAQTQPGWCQAVGAGVQFTHGHRNQLTRKNNDANVNYIIAQRDRDGQPFKRGVPFLCAISDLPCNGVSALLLFFFFSRCTPRCVVARLPFSARWARLRLALSPERVPHAAPAAHQDGQRARPPRAAAPRAAAGPHLGRHGRRVVKPPLETY